MSTSAPGTPRAGLVGPGTIGQVHVETLRALGIPVTGIVASSPASGQRHAQRLGIAHAYGSVGEMAASGEVDVVHVCVPNSLHADAAIEAIGAGCDVVCEKPLTLRLAEAEALVLAASRAGAAGGTCYHYRYFEGVAAARGLVRSGALGTVHMITGHYLSQELRGLAAGHWLRDPAAVGPSLSLADVGTHWFDLAEHVSGERIGAVLAEPALRATADAFGHGTVVLMRLGEATAATVAVSQACVGIEQDELALDVYGSAGTLRWSLSEAGEALRVWSADRAVPETRRFADSLETGTRRAFRELFVALYARIRSGESAAPSFADGHRGVAILHAAVESATRAQWVEVPQIHDPETVA
jgi:predicted dehydrogenase